MSLNQNKPWIIRDYLRCSGCKLCEVACSLKHENRIWPEASRVRVFTLVPGAEVPHLCTQCSDYPCVSSCPQEALSVHPKTGAVIVDDDACTACGICAKACPGEIPHLHPEGDRFVICDLCGGEPECAKICTEAGYRALTLGTKNPRQRVTYDLYAAKPEDITKNLVVNLYGEKGEELYK
jgi:Fe-S-cluster-containing dehydrogenase component